MDNSKRKEHPVSVWINEDDSVISFKKAEAAFYREVSGTWQLPPQNTAWEN